MTDTLKSIEQLLAGLQNQLALITGSIILETGNERDLKSRIAKIIESWVQKCLPNLKHSTIRNFRKNCGRLITRSMQVALEKAENLKAPWHQRIIGLGDRWREERLQEELLYLRIQLANNITLTPTFVDLEAGLEALTEIKKSLRMAGEKISNLRTKKILVQQRIDALRSAKTSVLNGKRALRKDAEREIRLSAERFGNKEVKSDSDSFLSDALIAYIVLNTMFDTNERGESPPQEAVFEPGGGKSGGGGASGSFDDAEKMPEINDENNSNAGATMVAGVVVASVSSSENSENTNSSSLGDLS